MPYVAQLPKPAKLQAVMRSLSSVAHVDALHVVGRAGSAGVAVKEVGEALGCSRTHANRLLRELEEDGMITGAPGPKARSPRPGNPTLFTLNAETVDKALDLYRAHMMGTTRTDA